MLTGKKIPEEDSPQPLRRGRGTCTRMHFETDELYGRWFPWISHAADENESPRTVVFTKQAACDDAVEQMRRMRGQDVDYDANIGVWRVTEA